MLRRKRFKAPRINTVIGEQTAITGDLSFYGGLHLDGRIVGNVHGQSDTYATLIVSDKGIIEGDVRVENLILNGTVNGDVYASQRVELAGNARVSGTVYYRLLEMAMGAEVNGKLVHDEEQAQSVLASDEDAAADTKADTPGSAGGNT
jgi:cytoskeletal protein CcmA (bactofilin family)